MKKRWICLYVENEIGVMARISGLFSGKSYNMDSITVGVTEDPTVSRMTISFTSDDRTFEQVKKQLNRSVEVIKVVDYTDIPIHKRDNRNSILVECVQTEDKNDNAIKLFKETFPNRIEVIRGGSVAVEAIGIAD